MTALIVAVKGGYTQSVKEILKRNPNVNLTDKDGNTALMIASKEGHTSQPATWLSPSDTQQNASTLQHHGRYRLFSELLLGLQVQGSFRNVVMAEMKYFCPMTWCCRNHFWTKGYSLYFDFVSYGCTQLFVIIFPPLKFDMKEWSSVHPA